MNSAQSQSRVFVLLLDSLGVGASRDAGPDEGADTLGHIAEQCHLGQANRPQLKNNPPSNGESSDTQSSRMPSRQGPLHIPNLSRLGLASSYQSSTQKHLAGVLVPDYIEGAYGYAVEKSVGKDTPSGHWELMGVPVMDAWTTFPKAHPCFPSALIDAFIAKASLPGVLGECHASGTDIIAELGEAHIATGKPIVYTSGDSVFQIAAHEEHYGLDKLYANCELVRQLIDPYNVGRVIARPFDGDSPSSFERTANRKDWATPPPADTLLDILVSQDRQVIAIGKTGDIFAHRGISESIKAHGIEGLFDATLEAVATAPPGSLTFTNFVDFDSHFGHRRDVSGYADALERLDLLFPSLESKLRPDDVVVLTADHGCDPTWPGSDHTREHIPVVMFGSKIPHNSCLGELSSFADVGQTLAHLLGMPALLHGQAARSIVEVF